MEGYVKVGKRIKPIKCTLEKNPVEMRHEFAMHLYTN